MPSTTLEPTPTALFRSGEAFARHTTMRVGGPIRFWAEPNSEDELAEMLREIRRRGLPLQVLGAGSNIVAPDTPFDGAVLHLGRGFEGARTEGSLLIAGGAALLPKMVTVALRGRLGLFEWACGVPGTAGGSLWGNAGARGFNGRGFESRDCAADFHSLVAFSRDGNRHELQRGDVEFAYRKSSLGDLIVSEARFELKPLSEEEARRHTEARNELLKKRRDTQPVSAPSAGCIWKNPDKSACEAAGCRGAGDLIDKLGLKGLSVGGARVSEIHGNFLVSEGGTASDVRALASEVERQVLARAGVRLEREARFWEFSSRAEG